MEGFRVQISTAGRDTYGAGPEGTHDDLVLAVAMACWWGEMGYVAVIDEDQERPFEAFSLEGHLAEWDAGHRIKRDRPRREGPPEFLG